MTQLEAPPPIEAPSTEAALPPGLAVAGLQDPSTAPESQVSPQQPVEQGSVGPQLSLPSTTDPAPIKAPVQPSPPTAQPEPATTPTTKPQVVATTPAIKTAEHKVVAEQQGTDVAPKKADTPVAKPISKPTITARPTKQAPKSSSTNTAKSLDKDTNDTLKPLITTSAEALGLQSIQEGAVTLAGKHGLAPQRLQTGDRLPSGEMLIRIDANSMALVTDRYVTRIN